MSGGIVNNDFTANLLKKSSVKNLVNRLKFDRIMAMSLWPHLLVTLYSDYYCVVFIEHSVLI